MNQLIRRISVCFAAGCVGALVNTWLVCYLGRKGIPQLVDVKITPKWSLSFLYPRLVWGGLWGILFAAPIWRGGFWTGVFSRGILFSFFPTMFQLLYAFPFLQHEGMFGLTLGRLTPVFVCLYNAVWGFCAAFWLYLARD